MITLQIIEDGKVVYTGEAAELNSMIENDQALGSSDQKVTITMVNNSYLPGNKQTLIGGVGPHTPQGPTVSNRPDQDFPGWWGTKVRIETGMDKWTDDEKLAAADVLEKAADVLLRDGWIKNDFHQKKSEERKYDE